MNINPENCSRIIHGNAWTEGDAELFSDLLEEEQNLVKEWIYENITPRNTPLYSSSSYALKHVLERDTGIYMTNNQFKDAMLTYGYKPVNQKELNWSFRISKKSPAYTRKGLWRDGSCIGLVDKLIELESELEEDGVEI